MKHSIRKNIDNDKIKAEALRITKEANTLCSYEDIGYKMLGVKIFKGKGNVFLGDFVDFFKCL